MNHDPAAPHRPTPSMVSQSGSIRHELPEARYLSDVDSHLPEACQYISIST